MMDVDRAVEVGVDLAVARVGDHHRESTVVAERREGTEQADAVEEVLFGGVVGPHQQALFGGERADVAGQVADGTGSELVSSLPITCWPRVSIASMRSSLEVTGMRSY